MDGTYFNEPSLWQRFTKAAGDAKKNSMASEPHHVTNALRSTELPTRLESLETNLSSFALASPTLSQSAVRHTM